MLKLMKVGSVLTARTVVTPQDREAVHSGAHQPTDRTARALMALALVATASTALVLAGRTPAPLGATALLVGILVAGQWMRWAMALAAVSLTMSTVFIVLIQVSPLLELSMATLTSTYLIAWCASGLVLVWRGRTSGRWPTRSDIRFASAALVVPTGFLAFIGIAALRSERPKLSWLMQFDSAWTLISSRIVLADGGVSTESVSNPAPATGAFLAAFMAPGRSGVPSPEILTHDLVRTAQLILLALAFTSLLASVLVASVVPPEYEWTRAGMALVAGTIPWTWLVAGHAVQMGFWNAIFATVFLLLTWLAWVEAKHRPVLGTALLSCAATSILATWAPVSLLPVALGVALLGSSWRSHVRLRGLPLILWATAAAVFATYSLFVTLPTFRGQPGALALNGWIFETQLADPIVALVTTVAVLIIAFTSTNRSWEFSGALVLIASSAATLAYLMHQRSGQPDAWGYYPAKYGWLVTILMVFIAARAVASLIQPASCGAWGRAGLVFSAAVVASGIMIQIPPRDLRPASTAYPAPVLAPDWRGWSMFPALSIARDDGMSEFDDAAQELVQHSDPREKIVFSNFFTDPNRDFFANLWLLQQPGAYNNLDTRGFAFLLSPTDVNGVCDLIRAWGGGVTVLTSLENMHGQMAQACPTESYRVLVEDPRSDD